MTISQTIQQPLILVVDDHPINRGILSVQLEQLGLQSETAENGRSGLALWREGRFSLVISDCNMPEMSGHELTRAIRKDEATENRPRTPVLAWTDHAQGEESSACYEAGMDEMLSKPINIPELRLALEKWLPSVLGTEENMPPVVNLCALHEQIGNDPQLVRQFCQIFQDSAEQAHSEIRLAIEMGDIVAARSAAHRLKSPARSIGAISLGDICAQIEAACQAAFPVASISALLHPFEVELANVNRYLDSR